MVVVVALDRLGRSLSGIIRTVETLTAAGVLLRSLREGSDYSTATGPDVGRDLRLPSRLRTRPDSLAGRPPKLPLPKPGRSGRSAPAAKRSPNSSPATASPAPPSTVP